MTTHQVVVNDNNNDNYDGDICADSSSDAIRIDTPICKISYWQIMAMVAYFLTIGLIILLAHIVWWVWLLLILVSVMMLVGMYLRHSPLIHLTSPKLYHQTHQQGGQQNQQQNQSHKLWQLLFDKPEYHELWEANLIQCRDFGRCIQLQFAITHPMPETLTLVLWQDQIEPLSWRRLKALARW